MNEKTKQFVSRKFQEYYRRARIEPPSDFWMREWGFVLFDPHYPSKLVMRRHTSFGTKDDLVNYLRESAPAHAYHSAAVYKYPTAAMAEKGWIGADLIFDLDADHIVSETDLPHYSYEDLLALVKEETLKLVDFLRNDFGFADDDIELAFSGSRGYHIHITTKGVRGLGSRERREIVDYVMATGFERGRYLLDKTADYRESTYGKVAEQVNEVPLHRRETIRKKSGDLQLVVFEGWGKRLNKGLVDFIAEIRGMGDKEGIKKLNEMGISKEIAKKIVKMTKEEVMIKRLGRMEEGELGFWPTQVWDKIIEKEKVKSADRVDEPVTADIKRLIRLPSSLHGKSSLKVKPLTIETFKEFDPLADAVVFGDSPVEISAVRNSSIELKGERYKVEEGEIASVPEHVALYFLCRGAAELT
jgi:DNA primase small subunit